MRLKLLSPYGERDTMTTRLFLAISCFLLTALLARTSFADLDAGKSAYESGDYATALREFKPLAEQGDADAQFNLGFMYDKGLGVPQDDQEALKWYRKAAEQGNAFAQFNLGVMYYQGRGVPQDYQEALKWYQKAAEQGNAFAQYNLGFMSYPGRAVPLY